MMRLALGTAQFGLNYGVVNATGQICLEQASRILLEARQCGIDTIDTAISYGNSEERLGALGVQDLKVVSKLPALPDSVVDLRVWVSHQVRGSLKRLGVKRLDGVLLHRPSDLLGRHGRAYSQALCQIREEGLATSVGYSIYSPDELESLSAVFAPDIVQAPYSIVDRRLATTGWMARLAEKGIRIHTRSAFLQGLLLVSEEHRPKRFDRWKTLWRLWAEACLRSEVSPLALSLAYVLTQSNIERVVVGVDSVVQLMQVVEASRMSVAEFPDVESRDLDLIDPTLWNSH